MVEPQCTSFTIIITINSVPSMCQTFGHIISNLPNNLAYFKTSISGRRKTKLGMVSVLPNNIHLESCRVGIQTWYISSHLYYFFLVFDSLLHYYYCVNFFITFAYELWIYSCKKMSIFLNFFQDKQIDSKVQSLAIEAPV